MSNLIITLTTLLTAGLVLVNQRVLLQRTRDVNRQQVSQCDVLQSRADDLAQRRVRLQRRLSDAQDLLAAGGKESATVPLPPSEAVVPPDPARQGGWPASVPYFYLPKKDLGSVGYQLFENNRLTEDAATLFGMTATEREAVDAAYDDLWRKFRELEIERMKPMTLPTDWDSSTERSPWGGLINPYLWKQAKANGCIAYYIPSLETEATALSNEFASTLEQALGSACSEPPTAISQPGLATWDATPDAWRSSRSCNQRAGSISSMRSRMLESTVQQKVSNLRWIRIRRRRITPNCSGWMCPSGGMPPMSARGISG